MSGPKGIAQKWEQPDPSLKHIMLMPDVSIKFVVKVLSRGIELTIQRFKKKKKKKK